MSTHLEPAGVLAHGPSPHGAEGPTAVLPLLREGDPVTLTVPARVVAVYGGSLLVEVAACPLRGPVRLWAGRWEVEPEDEETEDEVETGNPVA